MWSKENLIKLFPSPSVKKFVQYISQIMYFLIFAAKKGWINMLSNGCSIIVMVRSPMDGNGHKKHMS